MSVKEISYRLWVMVIACLAFTSCQNDIVYSQFCSIPSGEWSIDDQASFDYTVADTTAGYDMLLYVRHTERYPYQNMWLFVTNNNRVDTIEFYLADDRGQWLGDKHHGFIEMPVLLEDHYHFADTGTYHMTVLHGMRDSLLRGVTDVGLEIRKNNDGKK